MKKILKFILFVFVCLLFFSLSKFKNVSYAELKYYYTDNISNEEVDIVKEDSLKLFKTKEIKIINKKKLTNLFKKNFILYEFENEGYSIYEASLMKMIEFSLSSKSPFYGESENLIYLGVGNYYKMTTDLNSNLNLTSLTTNSTFKYTNKIKNYFENYIKSTNLYSINSISSDTSSESVSVSKPEVLENANTTGFNKDGNCGYVAGALLIYYAKMAWGWDYVYDSGIISNQLVEDIQNGKKNDSTAPDLEDSLNDYLNAKGSPLKAKVNMWHIPSSHTFYDRVSEDKPVALFGNFSKNAISDDSNDSIDHAVTVYKVFRDYKVGWFGIRTYSNYIYTVHMGWSESKNAVAISDDYILKGGLVNLHK